MKKALTTLALSLMLSGVAHAVGEPTDMIPRFPINTKAANVMSTTAEQEKQDMEAQYYGYGNLCCVGYGQYCYLNGWYPLGWSCYCNSYGWTYYGQVCRY